MRTKSNTAVATSPAAMGKALVLLATSCAALSGQSTIPAARRGASLTASHRRSVRTMMVHRGGGEKLRPTMALHYRDGDEDQSSEMRAANRDAVAEASTTATPSKSGVDPAAASTPTPSTPTGHRVSTHFILAPIVRLMPMPSMTMVRVKPSTASSSSKEEDERQVVMDEYLEYVERRYARMHPKHHGEHAVRPKPRVVFDFHLPRKIFLSTLALHRSPPLTASTQQPQQEQQQPTTTTTASATTGYAVAAARQAEDVDDDDDPLNALGLTNLASARLRERLSLHVPRGLRDEASFLHHCIHPLSDHASSRAKGAAAAAALAVDAGGRTSSYIALSFAAQFKLLVATLGRIASAFVTTMRIMTAFGSRAFSEILNKGGFKNSLRMMSVASVAILFMFRPLFRGAMKQG